MITKTLADRVRAALEAANLGDRRRVKSFVHNDEGTVVALRVAKASLTLVRDALGEAGIAHEADASTGAITIPVVLNSGYALTLRDPGMHPVTFEVGLLSHAKAILARAYDFTQATLRRNDGLTVAHLIRMRDEHDDYAKVWTGDHEALAKVELLPRRA